VSNSASGATGGYLRPVTFCAAALARADLRAFPTLDFADH
jgi:hypothetical protein